MSAWQGGTPNVPSWAAVGFSVVIYVKWFKTEVNHSGKPARGRGRAAAHAQERPGVSAASHSFRLLANAVTTIKSVGQPQIPDGPRVTKARFHPEGLMLSLWAGDFETRLISCFPSGSKIKCQKPGLSQWSVVGLRADRPPSRGQSGNTGPGVLSL